MKKITKKVFVLPAVFAAAACMGVTLTSCGGGEKKVTGSYMSNNNYSYQNFSPTYNYRLLTVSSEQIETYDDDTYCFTVNSISYSNVTFGENIASDKATANDRGSSITKFYGAYTAVTDSEGDINLTIKTPTRVVFAQSGKLTVDTANWTDKMAESLVDAQGGQLKDEAGNPYTGETYLAARVKDFADKEIYINGTSYTFEYFAV